MSVSATADVKTAEGIRASQKAQRKRAREEQSAPAEPPAVDGAQPALKKAKKSNTFKVKSEGHEKKPKKPRAAKAEPTAKPVPAAAELEDHDKIVGVEKHAVVEGVEEKNQAAVEARRPSNAAVVTSKSGKGLSHDPSSVQRRDARKKEKMARLHARQKEKKRAAKANGTTKKAKPLAKPGKYEDEYEDDENDEETSQDDEEKQALGEDIAEEHSSTKKTRFIAFIGNLPFTKDRVQLESALRQHFKKIPPLSIRPIHDKTTGKCKGYAFVEWQDWDRLQTAFQLYHHTEFNLDGEGADEKDAAKGKDKAKRKINVDITAGGGGGTTARKAKIKAKNERLNEQRTRYATQKKAFEEASKKAKEAGHGSVHPSRMQQVEVQEQ